jgi:alanine racemase
MMRRVNDRVLPSAAPGRAWLEIRLDVIARNLARMSTQASGCSIMAVLKANAYGLGAGPIAARLQQAGVAAFGVASPQEALALRPLGLPIWIASALLPDEVPDAVAQGLIAAITDLPMARRLSAEALRQGRNAQGHIVVDTGMGRVGIPWREAEPVISAMAELPGLRLTGLGSHFPDSAGDPEFSNEQVDRFLALLAALERRGLAFAWRHMANSDALRAVPRAFGPPFNLARTGLNLYGVAENAGDPPLNLEAAVTLKARLIAVRRLPAGHTIGYGRTHRLDRDTMVGTLAIGYADGVPFALANRGAVLVRGRRCPILGRVSMDYTAISLEEVPDAHPGEEAVCLGDGLPVAEWARLKGTIPYDILCAFGPRIERRHISH